MKGYTICCCVIALFAVAACLESSPEIVSDTSIPSRLIVGYYTDWAQYHKYCQNYNQFDPSGFTHVILGFGKITDTFDVVMFDDWGDVKIYAELREAKLKQPNLRNLLALGGWNYCQEMPTCKVFPTLASTPENRAKFIGNLISFLRQHGFDGVDYDWEYPEICGTIADQANYVSLVKDTREAFIREAADSGKERMLVTAALPVPQNHPNMKYAELSQYLDWINLMTYDLAGAWDGKTGAHSALTPMKAGHTLNIQTQVEMVLAKGVPKNKLVVGFAFYGRSFTLADASKPNFESTAWNGGQAGPCSVTAGHLSWFEIDNYRKQPGVTTIYDEATKTMVSYKGTFWIGYDDATTIKKKGEYVVSNGLRGGMVWAMDQDDEPKTLSRAVVSSLSGTTPLPSYCPNLTSSQVSNSQTFACNTMTPGQTCTYYCKTGYAVNGFTSSQSTCSSNLVWSPTPIGCTPKVGYTLQYSTGSFGACTGECGTGTQTRTVTCVRVDDVSKATTPVPAVECETAGVSKPSSTQSCTLTSSKCAATAVCQANKCQCPTGTTGDPFDKCVYPSGKYAWQPSEWTACTGYCGVGTQYRTLSCVDATTKSPAMWSQCQSLDKPAESQSCQLATKCKCQTHCDCITWSDSSDNDPVCVDGTCIPFPTCAADSVLVPAFVTLGAAAAATGAFMLYKHKKSKKKVLEPSMNNEEEHEMDTEECTQTPYDSDCVDVMTSPSPPRRV